jgi:hypothetical protein
MEKIESLTVEQKEKIPIYLKKYYDKVYNGSTLDKEKAKKSIEYIYTNAGYKIPFIWYCQSTWQAQVVINLLKNKDQANLRDNLVANLWDNLKDNLNVNLRDNLWTNLSGNLWDNLRNNLWDNLWTNLWANLGDLKFESFSWYGNISDYGWTCFYDFINHELIPAYKTEIWSNWLELIDSNIYDMIQMDGLCIVIEMPTIVNINENKRLHSETLEAVKFSDGYSVFAWNGIIIPEKWIKEKESIAKDDIIKETNAEKRRCLQEILGSKRYAELLNIQVIDEDVDQYGYPIKLWRTKEIDTIINEHIYFLNVICNSTKREYYLCVPECKNAWEAKAWTAGKKELNLIFES